MKTVLERLKVSGQEGFSLVELMVALVIGLLVMFGAIQVFVAAKVSYNRTEELSSRQESLRFFADMVSLDIRSSSVVGIQVLNGGDDLVLKYDTRVEDPYCGMGDELADVRYNFSALNNYVRLSYSCVGASGAISSFGPNVLVNSIEDVNFYDHLTVPDADAKIGYIGVEVSFPIVIGESGSDSTFSFRVANREAVAR